MLNYGPVGYGGGSGCVGCLLEYALVTASYDGGWYWGGYGAVADICCCADDCGCTFRGGRDTGGFGLMCRLFI